MGIDTHYLLTPGQIESFRVQGFIKLKNVFDAGELAHYGHEISRLTLALNEEDRPLAERTTYKKAFLQVANLWEHSPRVREFVCGKRLARVAAELLEVNGVRLYHDQALYKEPGGGFTPAHADQFYWPLATDRTVTAWVPLQAVPEPMGPLCFYSGSQRIRFGRDLAISDLSEQAITTHMRHHGFGLSGGGFELGEVSFHNGWTFHRANGNSTSNPRAVMTVIYMDMAMRMKAPANHMEKKDGEIGARARSWAR